MTALLQADDLERGFPGRRSLWAERCAAGQRPVVRALPASARRSGAARRWPWSARCGCGKIARWRARWCG